MHTLSSFIVSGLLYYFFKEYDVKITDTTYILFIFSFAMMIASLWEVTEFSIDRVFDSDMQKDTVITEIKSKLLSIDGRSVIKKKINKMIIGTDIIDGYIDIGLHDTIGDIVSVVGGSMIFVITFKLKEAF